MDGISNLTHDYIRGKGTFLILKGILEELKRNHVTFSITCTVNKRNIFEIEKLIDYVLLELNADSLFVSRLRPVGRAAYNTDLILDDNENKFIQQLCLEKKKYGERLILADDSTMRLTSSINRIACSAGNSLLHWMKILMFIHVYLELGIKNIKLEIFYLKTSVIFGSHQNGIFIGEELLLMF